MPETLDQTTAETAEADQQPNPIIATDFAAFTGSYFAKIFGQEKWAEIIRPKPKN